MLQKLGLLRVFCWTCAGRSHVFPCGKTGEPGSQKSLSDGEEIICDHYTVDDSQQESISSTQTTSSVLTSSAHPVSRSQAATSPELYTL